MQLVLNNLAARRKRFLNLAFLLVLLISQRNITVPSPVRSCRRLKRNTGWWENVCNTYSDARFKKTFRVSRDTFNFIPNRIAPFLIRQTVTKEPISPALRLAICLYRLQSWPELLGHKGNKPVKMTYFLPPPPPDAMLMSGIQVIFGRLNIAWGKGGQKKWFTKTTLSALFKGSI